MIEIWVKSDVKSEIENIFLWDIDVRVRWNNNIFTMGITFNSFNIIIRIVHSFVNNLVSILNGLVGNEPKRFTS